MTPRELLRVLKSMREYAHAGLKQIDQRDHVREVAPVERQTGHTRDDVADRTCAVADAGVFVNSNRRAVGLFGKMRSRRSSTARHAGVLIRRR